MFRFVSLTDETLNLYKRNSAESNTIINQATFSLVPVCPLSWKKLKAS